VSQSQKSTFLILNADELHLYLLQEVLIMPKYEHGLLSEAEAAAHLGVSTRTVRRYVDEGLLDRVRLGGSPAYPWSSIWRLVGVHPQGRERAYARPLLTVDDVARRCAGFPPSRIKRLAREGEIPAHRVGKAWRFVPVEIDNWLRGLGAARTANVPESADLAAAEQNTP
jgi:excisionase family DNA binding protein